MRLGEKVFQILKVFIKVQLPTSFRINNVLAKVSMKRTEFSVCILPLTFVSDALCVIDP